jgi:CheY-like chemotaxis protein
MLGSCASQATTIVLHPHIQNVLLQLEEATHTRGALFLVRAGDEPWPIEWARGPDLLLGGHTGTLTAEPTLWWRAVLAGDRESVRAAFVTTGSDLVLEYRVSVAGSPRWIRESLRRVTLPDAGERWVSVVRDITVERTAERPGADPPPATELDPRASAGDGVVVLLVEDDDAVRTVLARVLAREGYATILAGSVGEALRVFEKSPREPRILVCDVILPDRSGTELARVLVRRRPDLKVLFMSGYGQEELERRDETMLGHPLLPKPFTPADLVRAVRSCLDVRRSGGSGVMSGPESAAC